MADPFASTETDEFEVGLYRWMSISDTNQARSLFTVESRLVVVVGLSMMFFQLFQLAEEHVPRGESAQLVPQTCVGSTHLPLL